MLITDHINLSGRNPLIGHKGGKSVFVDMTSAYSPELVRKIKSAARSLKINLQTGVYAFQTGPSYETPAEIRMLKKMGADAVGMSTVPEVITARQLGIRTVAMSVITNKAAGIGGKKVLGHKEVLDNSLKAQEKLIKLIKKFASKL